MALNRRSVEEDPVENWKLRSVIVCIGRNCDLKAATTTRTTTTETKQRDNANEDNDNIDTKIFPPKEVFNKKFKFKDLHSLLCLCLVCQSV